MNPVRTVRRAAGLGVRECASLAGVAHARICEYEADGHQPSVERLQDISRVCGLRFVPLPVPFTTATAAEAADEIYEFLLERTPLRKSLRVVFQLNDDLSAAPDHILGALVATPAPATGDVRLDALIAGLVEWHVRRRRLPIPPWVLEPTRTIESPWKMDPHGDLGDAVDVIARHGVIISHSELASV